MKIDLNIAFNIEKSSRNERVLKMACMNRENKKKTTETADANWATARFTHTYGDSRVSSRVFAHPETRK